MTEQVFKSYTSDQMSNDFYHSAEEWTKDYISGSSLSEIHSSCFAAWKHKERSDSKALVFGTQSHTNFESKALFEKTYRRAPDFDQISEELRKQREKNPDDITLELITTQSGLASKLKALGLTGTSNKQYPELLKMAAGLSVDLHVSWVMDLIAVTEAYNDGVELVPAKDYDACVKMREVLSYVPEHDACMNSETAYRELSIFGEIEGVKAKVRLDHVDVITDRKLIEGWGYDPDLHPEVVVITDYKTTQSANPNDFPRLAYNLGYYLKMALQRDLFKKCFDEKRPIVVRLLAQEKKEPYLPMAYRLADAQIKIGREQYMGVIRQYKVFSEINQWPSYLNGEPEVEMETPAFVKNIYKEYFPKD
ncbi:PD-(D/E)XK nuclease-like domain-containing protein [Hafnia sp.]